MIGTSINEAFTKLENHFKKFGDIVKEVETIIEEVENEANKVNIKTNDKESVITFLVPGESKDSLKLIITTDGEGDKYLNVCKKSELNDDWDKSKKMYTVSLNRINNRLGLNSGTFNSADITAKCENGVLTVTIKKGDILAYNVDIK